MRNKENVIQWAKERGILAPDNAQKQCLKMFSEAGELADALIKNDEHGIIDGIGDVVVTLIILAEQRGYDIEDCLELAYLEIKNRTGRTENGVFIKDKPLSSFDMANGFHSPSDKDSSDSEIIGAVFKDGNFIPKIFPDKCTQ